MTGLRGALLAVVLGGVSGQSWGSDDSDNCQAELMLAQLRQAIEQPELSSSYSVVVRYGTDQRHYPMVRGWLLQQVQSLEGQRDGYQDSSAPLPQRLTTRVAALRSLIQRIDLE